MKPIVTVALVVVVAAAASGVGYWWGAHKEQSGAAAPGPASARKVLHYRNPMVPSDTSPVPKIMPDGMNYVPVYDDAVSAAASGLVRISPDKVQKLGVRTEAAVPHELVRTVRAVAMVMADERRVHTVAPRFEGWIQKLHVNTTGQAVTQGQALMEIYSPDLITAQEEYLIAWRGLESVRGGSAEIQAGMQRLVDSSVQRLRNWDIAEADLRLLQDERKAKHYLTLRSPVNGVVLEKVPVSGQRFTAGEVLYQIADLSSVWLLAEVFEQDLALLHVGQAAEIHVDAYPDKVLTGRVAFIYPTVNPETRAVKVRVELANTAGLLKPAMYARAEFASSLSREKVLSVPDSAVLDTGTRQLVLVQRGEGQFEPQPVRLGRRADGYVEVLAGVRPGDNVVVSANFLIDADSNLTAALAAFGGHSHAASSGAEKANGAAEASTPAQRDAAGPPAHAGH